MTVSSHGKHGNHTETRKILTFGLVFVVPPPSPTRNPRKRKSKICSAKVVDFVANPQINGIHEKVAGAGWMRIRRPQPSKRAKRVGELVDRLASGWRNEIPSFFQKRIAFILFLILGRKTTADVLEGFAPWDLHVSSENLVTRQSLGRKSEICSAKTALTERSASAEVVDFVANPPPLRPLLRSSPPLSPFL